MDTAEFALRRAAPDEHARIGALTLAAYDAVGRIDGPYRDQLADPGGRVADGAVVLVAVDGSGVLGSVTYVDAAGVHLEDPDAGDCGFRMLAVDPAAQGRGIGRALVRACIDLATADDRARIAIHSMAWMPAAHALYASMGFTRRPDRDVRYPSGIGLAFQLDLVPDAADRFPPPGPVPPEPPWYEDAHAAHAPRARTGDADAG